MSVEQVGLITFRCPLCDAFATGALMIEVETLLAYRPPLVPMWPDGPLVEDPFGPIQAEPVDRLLRTSACGCAFPWSAWSWKVHVWPAQDLAELVVTARPET
jgi:hypothetical protein